jgi:hypothetical protein
MLMQLLAVLLLASLHPSHPRRDAAMENPSNAAVASEPSDFDSGCRMGRIRHEIEAQYVKLENADKRKSLDGALNLRLPENLRPAAKDRLLLR